MTSNEEPIETAEGFYSDLRILAQRKLANERADHTLQPTALAHEAYLRMRKISQNVLWQGRDHFMAVAAEVMRRILVDHARRRISGKREGNFHRLPLTDVSIKVGMNATDILAIHESLDKLAEEEPLAAELVKLRIFAGYTHIDAARHLKLDRAKADRMWAFSKARLLVLMGGRDSR